MKSPQLQLLLLLATQNDASSFQQQSGTRRARIQHNQQNHPSFRIERFQQDLARERHCMEIPSFILACSSRNDGSNSPAHSGISSFLASSTKIFHAALFRMLDASKNGHRKSDKTDIKVFHGNIKNALSSDNDDDFLVSSTVGETSSQLNMPGPLFNFFDVNGGGIWNTKSLIDSLGTNRAGEVNARVFASALLIGLAWWAGCALPANAKGGGGGSSSGSYSESYRDSYGSSSFYNNNPAFKRRFKNYQPIADPRACSNLPTEGELIDVLQRQPKKLGGEFYYVPATVESVNNAKCRFVATAPAFDDDARIAKTLTTERNFMHWLIPVGILSLGTASAIDNAFFGDRLNGEDNVPSRLLKSGIFEGFTTESDGSIQSVECNLDFQSADNDYRITGSGTDSFDGRYSIEGTRTAYRVHWVEQYDGFSVTVNGRIQKGRGTRINCQFTSSRGIRGRVTLKRRK